MKLTKSYIKEVIKEEIQKISEQPQGENPSAAGGGGDQGSKKTDKTAKRAGSSAVKAADEIVDGMLQKAASLEPRLQQLRTTDQRKLALTRSLLTKVVQMDEAEIDKMLQLIIQGIK